MRQFQKNISKTPNVKQTPLRQDQGMDLTAGDPDWQLSEQ